ncbi:hypothetical protein SRHO_G00247380 [Serrasalmus rhombeus]
MCKPQDRIGLSIAADPLPYKASQESHLPPKLSQPSCPAKHVLETESTAPDLAITSLNWLALPHGSGECFRTSDSEPSIFR